MTTQWRKSKIKRRRVSMGQLHNLIVEKVQDETRNTFSRAIDLPSLMRGSHPSVSSADLSSEEGLSETYYQSVEESEKLNDAPSRAYIVSNENHCLFKHALSLAEQLFGEKKELEDDLEKQKNIVGTLRSELRMLKERNIILVEELEEMKFEETVVTQARKKLTKLNARAKEEIKDQKLLIRKIQSDYETAWNKWDVNVQEKIEMLSQDLKKERALRKVENGMWEEAEEKLKNTAMRLEESKKEVCRLKLSLDELVMKLDMEKTWLSKEILRLSSERAFWDKKYDALARDHSALEIQLSEANDKLQSHAHIPAINDAGMLKGSTLAEQVDAFLDNDCLPRNWSITGSKRAVSLKGSDIDEAILPKVKAPKSTPLFADIFQNYLYITASAIKLHFPELDGVKEETLIDQVKNAPFYLYYDLMMVYMQEKMQKKAVDDLKKSCARHTSLWDRLKRLNVGRNSTKTKQISVLSRLLETS